MPAVEIEIINKLGLHARASAKFVGIAGQFPCQIQAGRTPESMVDGKSIMAMMMLAAGKGTTIHIKTEGEKDQEALDALVALINNYFALFCAGGVLVSIPISILFVIMQKFYVEGITSGADKG